MWMQWWAPPNGARFPPNPYRFVVGVLVCLAVGCAGELTAGDPLPSADGPDDDSGAAPGDPPQSNETGPGSDSAPGAAPPTGRPPVGQPTDRAYTASASVARRLSRVELDNALFDLFGDTERAASRLLPEDPFSPFDNAYPEQRSSAAWLDSLSALADDVSARVLSDAGLKAQLIPCAPRSDGDAACFEQVVEGLVPRALRRPLAAGERDRYLPLLDYATEDIAAVDNGFDTAVALLVKAVMLDPEFLYRVEVGTPGAAPGTAVLTGAEIATRLSFLLWGGLPDAQLLDEAAAGALADPDGRQAAARRMLGDPRARTQLQRFFAMWLGYRAVPHGRELAAAFQRETAALIDRVVFDEAQPYKRLFDFEATYIDDMLAAHYGLPLPGQASWVDYGDSGRAGLLSHGSFLSAFGKFSDTSPTQRGILVRERLLCQPVGAPPPDVMADQPPSSEEDGSCKVDRYAAHRQNAACASCHSQLDPVGFGLENYDLAGRYREHDDGLPDCAIDGEGSLPPYGDFRGPAALSQLIVESGELEPCTVRHFMTFAMGRAPTGNERSEVDRLSETTLASDGTLTDLIEAYVASDAFALRLEPEP